jgi:DNA-binding XRE family transcriptional regulator
VNRPGPLERRESWARSSASGLKSRRPTRLLHRPSCAGRPGAGFALGLQFTQARQARGLTQRQLSEITGVAPADIIRIERGTGNPTEATLQRLAAALGRKLGLVDAA